MNLILDNPQQKIAEIVQFIQQTFQENNKQTTIIAVSGGIDSSLSVTLATQALGAENVIPVMLPYGQQDIADGQKILNFNQITQERWVVVDIKPIVDAAVNTAVIDTNDQYRVGNLMARARMMVIYDLAKKHDALVCGTENKSEKYLGYFTRFGDEASDIEPIIGLYKTQVFQLAESLNIPTELIAKAPTAGLWEGQTDEQELGFSYEVADQVLHHIETGAELNDLDPSLVKKVAERVEQMKFKHRVPYHL